MTVQRQTSAIAKLKEIYSLLSRFEKTRLLFAALLHAAPDTDSKLWGVGSVFPLLQILSTPDRFTQGAIAAHFRNIGLTSTKEIALFLIAVFAIFLVLSNLLSGLGG